MIGVGDAVVCVDDVRRASDDPGCPWTIRKGAVYRVIKTYICPINGPGVNLDIDTPEIAARYAWHADRFRKIEKADDAFVERMRRIRLPETVRWPPRNASTVWGRPTPTFPG